MAFDSAVASAGFLAARLLYGFVLGYLALGNLLALEGSVGYARSKGVPLAGVGVPLGSALLLGGAASIVLGAFPLFGALAVLAFLVGVTPVMHDFWTQEGQDAQNERVHFLKNVGLAALALLFLALAGQPWPYSLGVVR